MTTALLRIGQAVRKIALEEAREVGLTPVQAQTLLFVRDTKSFATSVGRLANHLGATHASTVGVVDALVDRGLLRREPSATDRRVTLLRLTPEGEATCRRLERWGAALSRALESFSAEERTTLERGLGAVIASLRETGHLDVAEPCRGCVYFEPDVRPGAAEPHRCRLLQAYLTEIESRKNCPDFRPALASGAVSGG